MLTSSILVNRVDWCVQHFNQLREIRFCKTRIMLQYRHMTFIILISSIFLYHYFRRDPLESLKIITLRVQLQKALKEKMQAHVDNLQLATMCKQTEENNLKLLENLQELNDKFVKKSLNHRKCLDEKKELQQEINLLKKLFING